MLKFLPFGRGVTIEKIANFARNMLSGYVTERAKPCFTATN